MKEFQLIKDIQYEYNADIGLAYASPVRGVWNIVHIGTLVPEGHQIYVCPTSCLRGVVLTTAEMGAMDKLSTITVGEDNILEGDMEESLQRGTERIIRELPARPKMMMIFTSCIHHFMAVNYKRVYKILRQEFPDIDFIDCYMDPIMRRVNPVVPSLWRQIHRGLKKPEDAQKLPNQVNYIGNCFPYGPEYCDLTAMLGESGITVRELNSCRTYEEFQSEAASAVNFVFHVSGLKAAKDMKIRLEQPWMRMRPGYNYDEFDEDLSEAAGLCGIRGYVDPEKNLEKENTPVETSLSAKNGNCQNKWAVRRTSSWSCRQRERTEEAVCRVREALGGVPVSIDYTAVDCPLELALFLLNHGIEVESVFIDVFTEREEIFRALQKRKPDLKIYQTAGWNIRQMDRSHPGKIVCIGQKSAYFMNSDYFVNVVENAGMYGYSGIRHLMELIMDAAQHPKPMKELVQIKGWHCDCFQG